MSAWVWQAARIVRVIDGDTVDAMLTRDLGFGGQAVLPVRLRLNRINAAKVSSKRGAAARDRVAALTTGVALTITTVRAYKYGGPADQLGEYMAEIVLPDGGNLSDVLIAEKLATAWNGAGVRPDDD